MPRDDSTRRVDMPVMYRLAQVQPETFDADKRTVEVVWTTGATVRRMDWWTGKRYDEVLSLDAEHCDLSRLNAGASVLNSHQSYDLLSVIGVVERAWLAKGADGKPEGRALIRFSARADVQPIVADIKSGVIRSVSAGYFVRKYEVTEEEGKIPVWRATDWQPAEISFVPIPADQGAGTRSAPQGQTISCEIFNRAAAHNPEANLNKDEILKRVRAAALPDAFADELLGRKLGADQIDGAIAAEVSRRAALTPAPAPAPQGATGVDTAAIAAEARQASAATMRRCRSVGLDDDFAFGLVERGITGDQLGTAITDEIAKRNGGKAILPAANVQLVADERDKFIRGASDWLITRAGQASVLEAAAKVRPELKIERVNPGEFRGMTLVDLARECLVRAGVNVRGMDKMAMVGMALTHRAGTIAQSTSDFAVLLENTMHKNLQAGYVLAPDTWSRICAVGTVSDFRAHKRYRMGQLSSLDSLTELGEFKHKAMPDAEKESITAATKGNIIAISRQTIINDDMDAFVRLPSMMGRAGKLSVEKSLYALLAENSYGGPTMSDGVVMFHATHANLVSSAPVTPSVVEADRMAALMGAQTDPGDGEEYLDLLPAIWLVARGYRAAARVVNEAQFDPDTANKLQRPNTSRGIVRDVVDTNRVSGTKHYMFADPAIAPAIEVAFLDGQDMPFLDNEEGFDVDGTRWKVRLDYGVAAVDWRPAVYNPGA